VGAVTVGDVAVVTVASAARREHLDRQQAALRRSSVGRIVVWLDETVPDDLASLGADIVHVPPGRNGLRLAAARNAGADRAVSGGADLVVFLDADCVPGRELIERYAAATDHHADAVLCGPVTYLPAGVDALDAGALEAHRRPHAARPDPEPGILRLATPDEYVLFWSLSFALSARRWSAGPRFDERFEGYGGEDTDFAFRLRRSGVPLIWVGGADAYHQHHPTSQPPVQHVDDILRNGALFAESWGRWPMTGWLEAFEQRGLVRREGDGWSAVPRAEEARPGGAPRR
jgi:N-acetylglucosaminyl-diphospho-decaprenol L-rhamnosyltransferase